MNADEQLLIECETIMPKVGQDCSHAIHAQMAWYKAACKEDDDKTALRYEGWLRNSLLKAKQELAKQQGLDTR